jgi:predicted aminopeptidase
VAGRRWTLPLMAVATAGGLLGSVLLAAAAVCLGSGCSSVGYYAQAVGGHLDLLQRARPVAQVLADAATPPALRERLQLSQRLRDFAVTNLQLPDNNSYRRFAELQRAAVVWNVVAAPALSLTLKTWCFPVMGCVGYRGYFQREDAEALAAQLRAEGLEVSLYGVPAYSTLGWSDWVGGDPLLSTFIRWPEGALAQLIFHELTHQVAYAADDTTFNESFAVAVERIGSRRWLDGHAGPEARAAHAAAEARREDFRALTLRYRGLLQQVYAAATDAPEQQRRKAAVMSALRSEYAVLKVERWQGYAGYDDWFAQANNASLGVLAAYNELVPEFENLLQCHDGDLKRFYAEVKRLAALPRDQRRARLAAPN